MSKFIELKEYYSGEIELVNISHIIRIFEFKTAQLDMVTKITTIDGESSVYNIEYSILLTRLCEKELVI